MIMVGVVYLLAFLMVSNIKYPAFKKFEFKKRVTFTRFMFVILFIYVLATIPREALFVLSFLYAVAGPGNFVFSLFRNSGSQSINETITRQDK